ncbi:hypothetical protein NIES4072_25540 [Nostoc commune NIES-4072]|uniref:Uncharacterized protein n=1 Tax=Nostoc commune NIES-4072 TaxID=2005467 RepID=A0A2R5FLJ4_NOSCO|nr:hypothetical protein NIES4070_01320 [Nostoc commune HK-02]GBG18889.1 hypothetical protein NIES4072_25540 [Nostoc commune NIES-4072]
MAITLSDKTETAYNRPLAKVLFALLGKRVMVLGEGDNTEVSTHITKTVLSAE